MARLWHLPLRPLVAGEVGRRGQRLGDHGLPGAIRRCAADGAEDLAAAGSRWLAALHLADRSGQNSESERRCLGLGHLVVIIYHDVICSYSLSFLF